jgi:hypothetical protein
MIEVVENVLGHDGIKFVKVLSSVGEKIHFRRFVPVYLLKQCPQVVEAAQSVDQGLGIVTTEIRYPICGHEKIEVGDGDIRDFVVVNFRYGTRVSDCIRLGVEGFWIGTKRAPEQAFVGKMPKSAEDGVEVHGVQLFEAEWMMESCVAVG